MELQYQLTQDDYLSGIKSAQLPLIKWVIRVVCAFAICIICLEIWLLISGMSSPRLLDAALNIRPLAIFLGIWAAFVLFLPRLSARTQFRGTPVAKLPVRLFVSDDGLRFQTSISDATVAREAIVKFIEDRNVFVCYAAARAFNLIPKRAFTTDEIDSFRGLVKRKVTKYQQV